MFFKLFSIYNRVQKWKKNPNATKREIGVVSAWMTADPANDLAVPADEIGRMKNFLRRHAPTSFASLFHDNR
jgi:hypothetical protein